MNDINLRQNVLDELEFEPSLNAANIGVTADDGVVTLTGHVGSYTERVKAEKVVKQVKGVRGLAVELEVRYPGDTQTSDDEIARRALQIIAWDTTIPKDKVQVKVEDGWVTLSGEVEWHYQKVDAEYAVHRLSGVKGITDTMTIKPSVEASDIKSRIENAFERNARIEADDIRVTTSGGKVTLDGHVKAWFERNAAENAAWAVPGVTAVDDRLRLS